MSNTFEKQMVPRLLTGTKRASRKERIGERSPTTDLAAVEHVRHSSSCHVNFPLSALAAGPQLRPPLAPRPTNRYTIWEANLQGLTGNFRGPGIIGIPDIWTLLLIIFNLFSFTLGGGYLCHIRCTQLSNTGFYESAVEPRLTSRTENQGVPIS